MPRRGMARVARMVVPGDASPGGADDGTAVVHPACRFAKEGFFPACPIAAREAPAAVLSAEAGRHAQSEKAEVRAGQGDFLQGRCEGRLQLKPAFSVVQGPIN